MERALRVPEGLPGDRAEDDVARGQSNALARADESSSRRSDTPQILDGLDGTGRGQCGRASARPLTSANTLQCLGLHEALLDGVDASSVEQAFSLLVSDQSSHNSGKAQSSRPDRVAGITPGLSVDLYAETCTGVFLLQSRPEENAPEVYRSGTAPEVRSGSEVGTRPEAALPLYRDLRCALADRDALNARVPVGSVVRSIDAAGSECAADGQGRNSATISTAPSGDTVPSAKIRDLAMRLGEDGPGELLAIRPIRCAGRLAGMLLLRSRSSRQTGDSVPADCEAAVLTSTCADQLAETVELAILRQETRRSREAVAETDRLSSIGAMTAELLHEIRNPLVAVNTFVEMVAEHRDDDEFFGDYHALTRSEVRRIDSLVGNLLAFSRSGGDESTADITEVVERTTALLEPKAKSLGVAIDVVEAPCRTSEALAAIDPDRIQQVVLNLVMNAIQACRSGGKVSLGVSRLTAAESTVPVANGGLESGHAGGQSDAADRIRLEVRDNGCGMTEAVRSRIFDSFYTTRTEGTGLGLAIVQRIVRSRGGSIEVRSEPGVGTCFSVTLPAGDSGPPVTGGECGR